MHDRGPIHKRARRSRQQGQVLLLSVALVALAIIGGLFAMVSSSSTKIANRIAAENTLALAQARDALIGRAVSDNDRPGSLPCPDADDGTMNPLNTANDGVADLFVGNNCPYYIGRLPWKTLGLPDLRDGNGERLWYALSPNFRDNAVVEPLNSDTKGTMAVYSGSAAGLVTNEAVAIVFAAGAPVGNQVRDTPGNQNNAANYLDSTSGIDNATGASGYIGAPVTTTFNDQLLVITTTELMTPVEMRAARETLSLLTVYRSTSACACYPWADISDGVSNTGDYNGRVPLLGATPEDWGTLGITVPAWLTNNRWWYVFFYTLSPVQSEYHGAGTLTVDGVSGYAVVLITTGPAGSTRPVVTWSGDADWAFYVDDSNNSDQGVVFNTPASTNYARDRLYLL